VRSCCENEKGVFMVRPLNPEYVLPWGGIAAPVPQHHWTIRRDRVVIVLKAG